MERELKDTISKGKMMSMLDCFEIYDQLSDLIFKEEERKKINANLFKNIAIVESNPDKFMHLENTNYSNIKAYTKFFEKYHEFETIQKKGLEINTPSFKFIEGVKESRIVPNPVGLVKRQGDGESVNIK